MASRPRQAIDAATIERSESTLVVAISSRALFDLADSHVLFEREGVDAFARYQIAREDELLAPGIAFPLVQKLLS
ncbi:MAG TPA: 5'-nucleotidase, partial [Rhodanobacteraceae bacterium]|nr:5'-nucleotidase [Rhodanobacteraceae bacterium]